MNITNRIPQEFKARLKEIQRFAPSAIIAGGAVRDTLNGQVVKDVDIFVSMDDMTGDLQDFLHRHGEWRQLGNSGMGTNGYVHNRLLHTVYDSKNLWTPTQVIMVNGDPVDYVEQSFDFGICKTYYDGRSIHCLSEYTRDMNNRTITFTLTDRRLARMYGGRVDADDLEQIMKISTGHAQRIKRKYPNFNIVMPTRE